MINLKFQYYSDLINQIKIIFNIHDSEFMDTVSIQTINGSIVTKIQKNCNYLNAVDVVIKENIETGQIIILAQSYLPRTELYDLFSKIYKEDRIITTSVSGMKKVGNWKALLK